MAELLRPKKKAKTEHLSSITIGYLASRKGSRKAKHWKRMRILLDSGCGATLVNQSFIRKLKTSKEKETKWTTKAGKFKTSRKCKVAFTLPAFHEHREINWNCYVDESPIESCHYDMIIGRDLMEELGMNIQFSTMEIEWDGTAIPMKPIDATQHDFYYIADSPAVETAQERIKTILDAKYAKADLTEVASRNKKLTAAQQDKLYQNFEPPEDITCGGGP